MENFNHHPSEWRNYQRRLKNKALKKRVLGKALYLALYSGGAFLILFIMFFGVSWVSGLVSQASFGSFGIGKRPIHFVKELSREDLPVALHCLKFDINGLDDHFILDPGGADLSIESTINPSLQDYISHFLKRTRTLQAAVVVLNPTDGRILAMANYNKERNPDNICLKAEFPAASLFKIVSAAAAFETAGFTPNRKVFFNGKKHTLYKKQLDQKNGRHTEKISFRKAFAFSINPVFGKLGIDNLGREVLNDYAGRFYFNRPIPFDLPVEMSTINIPEGNFGLAEIASGFNKQTLISPLHVSLLASVAANEGVLMKPWFVKQITNKSGHVIYRGSPVKMISPVTYETAKGLKVLMRDTVRYGTCRKRFSSLFRKKAFKDIDLGAKTGTINDSKDRFKYDWFTAFVIPEHGDKAFCIAILGIHGEKLGIRSSEIGMYIIRHYFLS
ncbi:MAG: hypothetical protein J7L16_01970 [Deltaproteobacteria bacterium]|nr:hypothetical protein [Deltaproteobacteria bacterium]